jgi:hypothetical protein
VLPRTSDRDAVDLDGIAFAAPLTRWTNRSRIKCGFMLGVKGRAMNERASDSETYEHYSTPGERRADYWVHFASVGSAIAGSPFLIATAAARGGMDRAAAVVLRFPHPLPLRS